MMETELTEQTGYGKSESGEKAANSRRNGKTSKTLRPDQGPMEIEVPRDRDSGYEPLVVRKSQREWRGFDDKILPMHSLGVSTQGIQENLKDIYNVEVSPELISRVTDEVKGLVEEWRNGGRRTLVRVLDGDTKRTEKPRRSGCFDSGGGRADRISRRD